MSNLSQFLRGFVLDGAGNFGIGRNPNYTVDAYKSGTTNATVAAANDNVVAAVQTVSNIQANVGTLTSHPLVLIQGNAEAARVDTSKNFTVTTAALIGYGTGAGGSVTQPTSKSTAVTLNKPCGAITMNSAALAPNAVVFFLVNNSLVSANDTILVNLRSGDVAGGSYSYGVASVVAGGFYISVRNVTAGSLSEALALNFSVIKGVTA